MTSELSFENHRDADSAGDLRVTVAMPIVEGDTVVFSWEQSLPNTVQFQNSFCYRYEGIDLTLFSSDLLFEIFMALQFRVFGCHPGNGVISFPHPVSERSVRFWCAYHNADNIRVASVSDVASYEVWSGDRRPAQRGFRNLVFFGGGKDSTLVAEIVAELDGRESVLLAQNVGARRPGLAAQERVGTRQENLMLRPAREQLGFATQTTWSDFQANFRPEGYHLRPHIELYTAGMLPVLLAYGVRSATFCYTSNDYGRYRFDTGYARYRFEQSRPEVLQLQSRHYQRVLQTDLTITNLAFPIGSYQVYRMLLDRYPAAFRWIVPCTDAPADVRWCGRCKKCAYYAYFTLGAGYADPDFDYERFFTKGIQTRHIVHHAESGAEVASGGNAAWHGSVATKLFFHQWEETIGLVQPGSIKVNLSPDAFANLLTIHALYGNKRFPDTSQISEGAIDALSLPPGHGLKRVLAEHFTLTSDELVLQIKPDFWLDYHPRMPVPRRLAAVEHVQ